jgi:hypothetical protein
MINYGIDSIYFYASDLAKNKGQVGAKVSVLGTVRTEFEIPEKFMKALVDMADTAMRKKLAEAHAEALGNESGVKGE